MEETYRITCTRLILGRQVATLKQCQSAGLWSLLVQLLTLMTLIFNVNGFCSLIVLPLICLTGLGRRGVSGAVEPFCLPWFFR